jgi:glyoxylase-like metal-dependent hydrolase (beta-lactamase superfamily II)
MPLRASIVPVTPFMQNCSLVWCDVTGRGAVIDPGGDLDRILEEAKTCGVRLEKILLTHAHIDHAGGTAELARQLSLPIEGPHEDDRFWIEQLPQQAAMFGVPKVESFEPTRWLTQGDSVTVGEVALEVRHCPGHTPGHVVFYDPQSGIAFVGDVLFAGSIGRTDFPRGDHDILIRSIRENLFPLGDAVRFVPGHGPMSTFGEERRNNPFVSDTAVRRGQTPAGSDPI